jgi:hypothetical protein
MTVHFESEALEEYRDAVLYSEERFGLGEQFVLAVESALDVIAGDPGRFQPVGDEIRIYRMKRFSLLPVLPSRLAEPVDHHLCRRSPQSET